MPVFLATSLLICREIFTSAQWKSCSGILRVDLSFDLIPDNTENVDSQSHVDENRSIRIAGADIRFAYVTKDQTNSSQNICYMHNHHAGSLSVLLA